VRGHLAEHRHHVDFRRRTLRVGLVVGSALGRRGRLAGARAGGPHGTGGDDAQVRQMAIDVGVDRPQFAERRLVQLLQDLELRAAFGLQRAERLGKRHDDRRGPEGVIGPFELRLAEQVADAAIERDELLVADVLDDADDVADEHRLVDGVEIDQRELRRVDLREVRLLGRAAGHAVLDVRAQPLLEFRHQRRAVADERLPRFEEHLLLGTRIGLARALDQHVAYAVEQRREREQQPLDGDVAAVGEDFRQLPGDGTASRRSAGRYVLGHRLRRIDVSSVCASSDFNDLAVFFAN
jgi:hypothetical protein